jgi:hemoglobin
MKEIKSKQEIIEMVDAFYDKVNNDPLLSPVFNEIAGVNWAQHLPKMYNFWDSLLFGAQSYKGKPFDHHLPLPLSAKHFERWLALFNETLDENFSGLKAEEAREKANNIAGIFKFKMYSLGALHD